MRFRQGEPCVYGHGVVQGFDLANAAHAFQREEDFIPKRNLTADEPRIAPLGRDSDIALGANLHNFRDFFCGGRGDDERRLAGPAPAPFGEERRRVIPFENPFLAHNRADRLKGVLRWVWPICVRHMRYRRFSLSCLRSSVFLFKRRMGLCERL